MSHYVFQEQFERFMPGRPLGFSDVDGPMREKRRPLPRRYLAFIITLPTHSFVCFIDGVAELCSNEFSEEELETNIRTSSPSAAAAAPAPVAATPAAKPADVVHLSWLQELQNHIKVLEEDKASLQKDVDKRNFHSLLRLATKSCVFF